MHGHGHFVRILHSSLCMLLNRWQCLGTRTSIDAMKKQTLIKRCHFLTTTSIIGGADSPQCSRYPNDYDALARREAEGPTATPPMSSVNVNVSGAGKGPPQPGAGGMSK